MSTTSNVLPRYKVSPLPKAGLVVLVSGGKTRCLRGLVVDMREHTAGAFRTALACLIEKARGLGIMAKFTLLATGAMTVCEVFA